MLEDMQKRPRRRRSGELIVRFLLAPRISPDKRGFRCCQALINYCKAKPAHRQTIAAKVERDATRLLEMLKQEH